MRVRILSSGKEVEAKYFKDMTDNEIKASTDFPQIWDDMNIFIFDKDESIKNIDDNYRKYMFDSEVEIIKE